MLDLTTAFDEETGKEFWRGSEKEKSYECSRNAKVNTECGKMQREEIGKGGAQKAQIQSGKSVAFSETFEGRTV